MIHTLWPEVNNALWRGGGGSEFSGARCHFHPAQRAGGAPAPYKRFAGGKTLAEGEFTSPEHFNFPRNPKKKDTTAVMSFFFGAGNEARTRFPASREWLAAIRRTPASPLIRSRLRRGVEAASSPPLFPAQRAGGAPAPCKHFCRGQKSWRRRNLLPPSILISHGIPKRRTRRLSCASFWERATRLELASRHPANGWPPFAGPLPHLRSDRAFGAGWRQRVRLLCKKQDIRNWMSCYTLERATRLELATSTLARWRSTR